MRPLKNILIVMSDITNLENNIALKQGVLLAKEDDSKITLMDIIPTSEDMVVDNEGFSQAQELDKLVISQRAEQLEELAQQLRSQNLKVTVIVSSGRDFIEIVKIVIHRKIDLLIKVANKQPNSFDSSDFHLMRKCPTPVWLIKPKKEHSNKIILAAVDLSMESRSDGKVFNRLIIDVAISLSQTNNAKLVVLSCWNFYGNESLRYGALTGVPEATIRNLIVSEESEYDRRCEAFTEEYKNINIHPLLLKGNPKNVIPDYVNKNAIDIVVMGTVGRSGVPGLLIGNTSESVLQSINSSVITLKPSGFKSPIS